MTDEVDVLTVCRRLALVGRTRDHSVSVAKAVISDLVKIALADRFDEEWYQKRYKDVSEAIRKGVVQSGLEHYVSSGIYEGRIPYPIPIDESDYLKRHRDVARSLNHGPYRSAAEHFYTVGFVEGRSFQIAQTETSESAQTESTTR